MEVVKKKLDSLPAPRVGQGITGWTGYRIKKFPLQGDVKASLSRSGQKSRI